MMRLSIYKHPQPLTDKKQQLFLYELHLYLQNGATLVSALEDMMSQEGSKVRARLKKVLMVVNNGEPFSQGLRTEKLLFDEIINIIEAGEKTHHLLQAIKLSDALLNEMRKRSEALRRALVYPLFLLLVCFMCLAAAMYLLLPQLNMIALSNNELAFSTRFFLFMAALSSLQWLGIGGALALLCGGVFYFRHTYFLSRCVLRFGLIGNFLLYQDLACFCHHMSVCMNIQLNMPQSLRQSTHLFKLTALKHHSDKVVMSILQGKNLAEALLLHPYLPKAMIQTVDGVRGQAALGESFAMLATHFEALGKRHLQRVQPFIEPMLTLFIGLIIAFFIHAIILPLYDGALL